MSKTITLEYIRTSVLDLCYSDEQVQAQIDRIPNDGIENVLLSLPSTDARRVLAGLLPKIQLVEWANNCSARAKSYADTTYATPLAAADTDAYATYATARAAEHKLAVQDAIRLLDWL